MTVRTLIPISQLPLFPMHLQLQRIRVPQLGDQRSRKPPHVDRGGALNRPWPPCDDQELVNYKLDTKARPSWKTIA